jgi:two-component system nitrogen regulation sensor histidine kinase NtrY
MSNSVPRLKYEHRILILGLMTGLAGSATSFFLLWDSGYSPGTRLTLTVLITLIWLGSAFTIKNKVVFPLRTLSNLLGALREGDYSLRARGARHGDSLGEVMWEANALAELLRGQRLGAMEATVLLRKILAEVDVAMFGFDSNHRLQLANDGGKRLLGREEHQLTGCRAEELGLAECMGGSTPRVLDMTFPGGSGRWELRRGRYRDKGVSHQLILLSDLTRTLHAEEQQAWRRLIRTVRHEVSNSLTPIQSVAESLRSLVSQRPLPQDWQEDLHRGLEIIAERSEALGRFIGAYSQLAHLPEPSFAEVDLTRLVRRVAGLETRMEVTVAVGLGVRIRGDRDQLEQLLINLISNGVEASLQARPAGDGRVSVGWRTDANWLELHVDDDGPGIDEGVDVFVPFYTTKENGSGIGLALSRQIAEAHGGCLVLGNHRGHPGCRACLRLRLEQPFAEQKDLG